MEADCAAARESLENTEANAAQLERRIDEIYAQSQSFTAEIERIRERVAALQEQAQEKEGNLSLLRSEIEHGQRLAARLQEDMRQDGEKLQDFDSQIEDQRARIDGNRTQISVLTAEAQALAESGVSIEAAEGGKRAQLDQLNRSVMELNGEVTELKLKIGYADNSISVQSENRSRLEEQARASAAATAQLSENAAQLEREGAELEERIQSAANVISGYRLRMQQAKDRLDAETEKRGALERAIAQKTLRLQTLRDMQAHFEGYYGSVRSVMQASARGVLRGVEGPVSELIRTQDRYAVAVETALGSQIQNIVVGTDADAKAAIQYLKSGGAGRATFLPVATIRGRVNEPSGSAGRAGYLGPASGVVECEPRYRGIVEWLLGRVCLVESLDDAVRCAKQSGYQFRMVTLDGQVVNAGGSLTGGSAAKGAGLLKRRGEIERMENELKAETAEFDRFSGRLKEIEEKYAADVAYVEGVEAEIRSLGEAKTVWTLKRDDLAQRLAATQAAAQRERQLRREADEQIAALQAGLRRTPPRRPSWSASWTRCRPNRPS